MKKTPEKNSSNQSTFRFTTNNAKTEPYQRPIPDTTDVYHHTRGSRYYSLVDFSDAFFTVALAEEDRDKMPHRRRFFKHLEILQEMCEVMR